MPMSTEPRAGAARRAPRPWGPTFRTSLANTGSTATAPPKSAGEEVEADGAQQQALSEREAQALAQALQDRAAARRHEPGARSG